MVVHGLFGSALQLCWVNVWHVAKSRARALRLILQSEALELARVLVVRQLWPVGRVCSFVKEIREGLSRWEVPGLYHIWVLCPPRW